MLGTSHGPPKVVAIIPLSRHADAASAVSACLSTACWLGPAQGGRQHATFLNNKARLCFMASGLDMMQALRAAQCADIVVLVLSAASPAHAIIDEVRDITRYFNTLIRRARAPLSRSSNL